MSYYIETQIEDSFSNAIERITASLQTQGFGVLSDIDVSAKLNEKLDADFRPYRILGACNPGFAHKALIMEPMIGIMLPCNVIVQEKKPGLISVAAVDPLVAMSAVQNPGLEPIATQVREKLATAIKNI